MTYELDWERDGAVVMKDAKTVSRYHKLMYETHADTESLGIFFAFDARGILEGHKRLIEKGIIRPDEKVVSGQLNSFGTREAFAKLDEINRKLEQQIKEECDPQEVYFYEYNNHECMYSYEGDLEAIRIIIGIWGIETAKKLKRLNVCFSAEDVANKKYLSHA